MKVSGPEAKTLLELVPESRLERKLSEAFDVLQQAATQYPDRIWEVGFSGGKDSSVVSHIVFDYISQHQEKTLPLPKKVMILYSDTLLDIPILRRHTLATLNSMKAYAQRFDGLVEVKILKPEQGHDYFSLLIDRGYPAPHFKFRWCMDRLKMEPTVDFLATVGDFCMVTGVRSDESNARRRNMVRRQQTEPISVVDGVPLIAPLLTWSQEDVWAFLMAKPQPWSGESYNALFEIYRLGDNLEGCGRCVMTPSSRFGCWVCTVVSKDRLLTSFAKFGNEYKMMLEAKERIRQISLKREFREVGPNGKYKGLNQDGRREVVLLLAEVLVRAPSAIEAYLEDDILRTKIKKWLEDVYKVTGSPIIEKALTRIEILSR